MRDCCSWIATLPSWQRCTISFKAGRKRVQVVQFIIELYGLLAPTSATADAGNDERSAQSSLSIPPTKRARWALFVFFRRAVFAPRFRLFSSPGAKPCPPPNYGRRCSLALISVFSLQLMCNSLQLFRFPTMSAGTSSYFTRTSSTHNSDTSHIHPS